MRVEFISNGKLCRGKVVATIVEEKSVHATFTRQFIRFVVLMNDGTFMSVPINECRKVRNIFQRLLSV